MSFMLEGLFSGYVGRDIDVSIALVKAALEESLGLSYEKLRAKALSVVENERRMEKVSILIRLADKDGKEKRLLEGFCKKYSIETVPIFNDLFSTEAPKTIIALSFNDKQRRQLPIGFISYSFKRAWG